MYITSHSVARVRLPRESVPYAGVRGFRLARARAIVETMGQDKYDCIKT